MATHLNVPGGGTLGMPGPFGEDVLTNLMDEADQLDAEARQGTTGTLPSVIDAGGSPPVDPLPPLPSPTEVSPPVVQTDLGPPGGRPPGLNVSTGSPTRGTLALLGAVGAAALAGYYYRDPKAALAALLVVGAGANLYYAKQEANPGTSSLLALGGLGLGGYLGYGVLTNGK